MNVYRVCTGFVFVVVLLFAVCCLLLLCVVVAFLVVSLVCLVSHAQQARDMQNWSYLCT